MNKTLISLEQHNQNKRNSRNNRDPNAPRPNGIACPGCGSELVDSSPCLTLTSSPPQKNTRCDSCGYTGYRIA
jgi:hypothetical protein